MLPIKNTINRTLIIIKRMLRLQIIYFKFTATDVIDIIIYSDRYKPAVID
ncbi:hypothetical protein NUKP64_36720 [Klebsiella variicola]|uniref:Uncharacterized protein n=1 Tax=Escherichia coli TaxID=562 RepID=A0A2R4PE25_ECOLX|nr:hypothetical protein [Escherichia coli]GKL71857.1 hypothetical protein NUBL22817_48370 [Klebsiella pneumoniae]GKL99162.1 hypothetical protein NUKP64_36720 [Klebsiella variicola]